MVSLGSSGCDERVSGLSLNAFGVWLSSFIVVAGSDILNGLDFLTLGCSLLKAEAG